MGRGEVGGSLEHEERGQTDAPLGLVEGECGWRVQKGAGGRGSTPLVPYHTCCSVIYF